MRLDPNLVRAILLQLEGDPPIDDHGWPKLDLPGRTDAEISYHVRIMHDALLIEAHDVTTRATPLGQYEWRATGLTSKGHAFLDAARDERVWNRALAKAGDVFAADTLSALFQVLLELGKGLAR